MIELEEKNEAERFIQKRACFFNLASHFDINHGFYSDGFGFDHVFSKWSPVNMTFNGLGNYQRMLTDATFKKLF